MNTTIGDIPDFDLLERGIFRAKAQISDHNGCIEITPHNDIGFLSLTPKEAAKLVMYISRWLADYVVQLQSED